MYTIFFRCFAALVVAVLFSSCSIEQEITFRANGSMKYNMLVDIKELKQMASQGKGFSQGKDTDSIVSLADAVKKERPDLLTKHPELSEDLRNIEPLFMRTIEKSETNEFSLSIYGDFENDKKFNAAFNSMNRLINYSDTVAQENNGYIPKGFFENIATYTWDGKVMTREAKVLAIDSQEELASEVENDEATEKAFSDFGNYLFGSITTMKYNFPKKVKSVSDGEALFSQDGKSVVIKYQGNVLTASSKKTDIRIEVE